jgi:ubiquinone/menaquinone biosynthesis C-methylase UbiE
MKLLLLVGFVSQICLFGQPAPGANDRYRTLEGRAGMAASLDGEHRDARQKPKKLIAALRIKPGMTVVDIGTGVGYMLPFLSAAVGPRGHVVAEDIFPDFLEKAKQKASALSNVSFVLGTEKDPNLDTAFADLIFILDAYHHFDYPEEMMSRIRRALKPGGRLALIDYYKRPGAMANANPNFAVTHIRLDEADVVAQIESFGYRAILREAFLPNSQWLALFEKK